MAKNPILTCAITGNLTLPGANENLPITPHQIATSSLEAAEAGAAIVHIHVRHPDGRPSGELDHYREVVERIREKNRALIINLTTGLGGRFQPGEDDPRIAGPRTTLMHPLKRVAHVAALRPDIATLDLNTMVFGAEVVINTPDSARQMAQVIYGAGVKPEIELFNSGDIAMAEDLFADGTLKAPSMGCLVLGTKYGLAATPETMAYAKAQLPAHMEWTGFGVGRAAFPMLVQAFLLGGNLRIGMEDTTFVNRGVKTAGNGELCRKARQLVDLLGGRLATAEEARERLELPPT